MKGKIITTFSLMFFFTAMILCQSDSYEFEIPGTETTIMMIQIPKGSALIGGEESEKEVTISSFWMSETEITYDQYHPFRDPSFDTNQSLVNSNYSVDAVTRPTVPYLDFTYGMGGSGGFPAVSMTQQAALRYCKWLYEKTGVFYRLPTEAEWEYACLGGKNDQSSSDLDGYSWNWDNSEEKYHKTGLKKANGYGLYDMLGNVSEYTSEQYSENYYSSMDGSNPHILQFEPKGKYGRSVRGGAYDDEPESCTCSGRIPSNPAWQARDPQIPKSLWWNPDSPFVGFRIVRPEGKFSKAEVNAYFKKAILD